jgi:response regulator RpfG family c-di-GMP phosphodiesterase
MNTMKKRFLIVDDDPENNLLSKMALKRSLGEVEVTDFIAPEDGLHYIESQISNSAEGEKIVLFLDINMPTMSGWEFLEKFAEFVKTIVDKFCIYILSSSVDPRDIQRAKENPLVAGFIEKPLDRKMVSEMFA